MSGVFKWYAVYTKPRWEKKVAELLTRQQVENYCPLNKVWRQWSDRKKLVHEPLFKSYVFVRIGKADKTKVREIFGILNFLNWLGKPAVIRDEEIELIKQFLNDHENVQAQKCSVKVNDTVRITSGPFSLQKGNVLEVRNNAIKVYLPSLGYQMIAEIRKTNIEVVTSTDQKVDLTKKVKTGK
jgi:transcription antitermination factor NusG